MRLILPLLVGCSRLPSEPLPTVASTDPDVAALPYTVDALREGNPTGRTRTFRVTSPGQPARQRTMVFGEATAAGAWVRSSIGEVGAEPERSGESFMTWAELQGHAEYPAEHTTISWANRELSSGSRVCVEYRVERPPSTLFPDGEVTVACFDPETPGPPITLAQHVGGSLMFVIVLMEEGP